MRVKQRGIGLAEVVIATAILTAGVGALLSIQVGAVEASTENLRKVEAMHIARDFIENVRTNPSQMPLYFSESRTRATIASTGAGLNCYTNECTPAQKAKWDLTEMYTQAKNRQFLLTTSKCQVNNNRECIFVTWGEVTTNIHINREFGCAAMTGGKLVVHPNAKCIFLEAF